MNLRGGYLPTVAGRPGSVVVDAPPPGHLDIPLHRGGLVYTPAVQNGQRVRDGEILAAASVPGGRLALPAPASGRVRLAAASGGQPERLTLDDLDLQVHAAPRHIAQPERTTAPALREALAQGGLWPFFWSSKQQGMPPLDGTESPNWIIVNCLNAEPFRTRGKVILRRDWKRVAAGIAFLPRLMADYGSVCVILTEADDPVARMMRQDLAGRAWVHVLSVPLRYPVEHPQVARRALRRAGKATAADVVWTIDVQALAAVGAHLAEGLPLHERIVAVGGPGEPRPRHAAVRIGTPLAALTGAAADPARVRLIRGGLLTGAVADPVRDAVGYDDDAFFLLPRPGAPEFLGFARAGFDRRSVLPVFGSWLTGGADRHVTTSLRGERRPCIACGLCESVCPVDLLPQVLHRSLYRQDTEEALAMGLEVCIRCGLCAYVCPSKLDLLHEFTAAQAQVVKDREEAAAHAAEELRREETQRVTTERKDEWRT